MGIQLNGVDQDRLGRIKTQVTTSAEPQLLMDREGAEDIRLPGLFIGQELAEELSLIPGDRVTLVSPTAMTGPLDAIPRIRRFAIEGIYKSGLPEQELH